ncbi:SIMPL domain-containing protein [Lysobacter enzymogenes]|uniref:SIMPL domain-containing protein n=1 Tax=Lysobacter enzymogenes TaxID=69 RepID=UPI001A956700|nr:SIMPL domain-containing protein [Lysobacter enzymogenes]QQP94835.1 SIMPL domain-containing protein [Lysobacter enzymogenes]
MPRPAWWLLLSAILIAAPSAAVPRFSELPAPERRSLNVSGSAEIKVPPDEVLISVGVESRAIALAEAKRLNDADVAKALAFLRASGVPDKDVQTDYVNIEPRYPYDNSTKVVARLTPEFYVARKSIGVRLTRIGAYESVLAGLLANGAQHVHGIEFRTSQLRKHRDAARALAIRAAQDKADALAHELGVRRGAVYSVSESYSGGWWRGGGWGGAGGGQMMQNVVQQAGDEGGEDDGATLAVGQISVNATVSASFAIE